MPVIEQQAVTLRLPKKLYKASRDIAKARQTSFNEMVQDSLSRTVREAKYQSYYDAFESLADDPEGMSVDFAFAAQAEVVLRDGE